MLKKPLKKRLELAKTLRERSLAATDVKDEIIMDVNQKEVVNIFKSNDIDLIIHGHTHRPKIHEHNSTKRVVLGDWDKFGWYFSIEENSLNLKEFKI